MIWTAEVINELRVLWSLGHSTAEIARRMGTTKNAIVGKAHRLDLLTRASPITGPPIVVSEETKELARRMWAEGKSSREVAAATGIPATSFSKKSVWLDLPDFGSRIMDARTTLPPLLSVARDLTVVPTDQPIAAIPRAPDARPRLTRAIRAPAVTLPRVVLEAAPVVPAVLFTRARGKCRWTDSDGSPWVWCDAPTDNDGSWCSEHHHRVFTHSRYQSVEKLAGL